MAETKSIYKYLDWAGLSYYNEKIKGYINDEITKINSSIANLSTIEANATKGAQAHAAWATFLAGFPEAEVTPTLASIKAAMNDLTTYKATNDAAVKKVADDLADYKTEVSGELAKKADNATVEALEKAYKEADEALGAADEVLSGRIQTIENLGLEACSTYAKAEEFNNYKTTNDIAVGLKADKTDLDSYYTKDTIDDKIDAINAAIAGGTKFVGKVSSPEQLADSGFDAGDIIVAGASFGDFKENFEYIYDGKEWFELGDPTAIGQRISDLEGVVSGKADSATTLAGYRITDAYTKDEIDEKVTKLDGDIATAKEAGDSAAAALEEYRDEVTEALSGLGEDIETAKTTLIGTDEDVASDDTIWGAKAHANELDATLRAALLSTEINATSDNYVIATISLKDIDTLFETTQA